MRDLIRQKIVDALAEPLPDFTRIAYGSAPATPALIRDVDRAFGVDLIQLYGMTECVAWACFLQPDEHRRALAGEPRLLTSSGRFASCRWITGLR